MTPDTDISIKSYLITDFGDRSCTDFLPPWVFGQTCEIPPLPLAYSQKRHVQTCRAWYEIGAIHNSTRLRHSSARCILLTALSNQSNASLPQSFIRPPTALSTSSSDLFKSPSTWIRSQLLLRSVASCVVAALSLGFAASALGVTQYNSDVRECAVVIAPSIALSQDSKTARSPRSLKRKILPHPLNNASASDRISHSLPFSKVLSLVPLVMLLIAFLVERPLDDSRKRFDASAHRETEKSRSMMSIKVVARNTDACR